MTTAVLLDFAGTAAAATVTLASRRPPTKHASAVTAHRLWIR